jgi:Zn-dependent peptidase ImmA (M78 family)
MNDNYLQSPFETLRCKLGLDIATFSEMIRVEPQDYKRLEDCCGVPHEKILVRMQDLGLITDTNAFADEQAQMYDDRKKILEESYQRGLHFRELSIDLQVVCLTENKIDFTPVLTNES